MSNEHNETVIWTATESEANLPRYMTKGAAGADVRAANKEPIVIEPGAVKLIPTGLFFDIPDGYEIQVRPRSGLALKHQLTLLNSPGTIDSDYRGELQLIMINHSKVPFEVTEGLRMAQIVVAKVEQVDFRLAKREFAQTLRGERGFGHSGVN